MKPAHKLSLIALFFAIIQQIYSQSVYADKELCKLYEPDTDQSFTQPLTTTPISISQNTCVKRFSLDLFDPMWRNQYYIYIEVQFDHFPDPSPEFSMMLLEGDDEQPIIYYSDSDKSLHEDAENADYDANRNRKTYHRINVHTARTKPGDTMKRYFAVYKLFEDLRLYTDNSHVVSYTMRAQASQKFECINNCSGHGQCDSDLRQCVCHPGFFDSDCSIKALRLDSGIPQSQKVLPKKSTYYYTTFESIKLTDDIFSYIKIGPDDVFKFTFSVDRPEWNMAIQFNYPRDFLINSRRSVQFTNGYPMSVLKTSKDYSSSAIPRLGAYFGGNILVFVSNPTEYPMESTVQVDIPIKGNKKILFIIAIVTGIMLFFFVLVAFVTKKCRARARGDRSVESEEAPRQRTHSEEEPVFLTKAEIENYFPLKQFSDVKTVFLQTACSICLEEFSPDSKCHQLYCEHIFHDHCIESWLAKQSNCPNCKSEMNKGSIENFLKEKNNKPQKSSKYKINQPESQQIELNINTENHENEADKGNLENSVYENSEESPIELQSPISSPLASSHSSRMLVRGRDKYNSNI